MSEEELKKQIEVLKKALEFYADEENWKPLRLANNNEDDGSWFYGGHTAKEALKKVE